MKSVTVMLMGLMLVLGAGTARAASGAQVGNNSAISVNDAALLLDGLDSPATLSRDTDPIAWTNGDEGISVRPSITVLGYAISNQVTIDLDFRPSVTAENDSDFVSSGIDVEHLTKNLMVGFRYKF
jgi:hypothetical protein